jgi:hypothetical protein
VDVEGYVSVNSIRYSVPVAWIGRRVEVRETRDKLEIELDARHIVTHERAVTPLQQRITLAARPRGHPAAAWGRCQAQRSAPGGKGDRRSRAAPRGDPAHSMWRR